MTNTLRKLSAAIAAVALAHGSLALAQESANADLQAQAKQVIDKGLNYLKSQQQPNGSWQAGEKDPVALTAIALRTFVRSPDYNSKTDFVAKGFENLLSNQMQDGGIYKDLLANYNTAIAISTLTAANDPAFKPQIDKAVDYLKRLQWTEETKPEYAGQGEENTGKQVVQGKDDPFYGGWGYGGRSRGPGRPDLSNTQLALEALHDAGVNADDPAFQRALTFVTRQQNFSETNPQPWAGTDGGFAYGPSADRAGESFAGEYTDAQGNRRLHSMGTMSYAGLKSMIYAGVSKDDPRVRAAWDWVQNNFTVQEHPGMADLGEDKAKWGLYYYYMTLGKTLRVYGQPTIKTEDGKQVDWRRALIEQAAKAQNEDGSWQGVNKYMEDNKVLATSYMLLALQDAAASLEESQAK